MWTLAEWTRGWIFTGFPWLAVGYSQVPASPLAGYAPVLGVYGVSLATALTAGLLALLWRQLTARDGGAGMGAEASARNGGSAHKRPLRSIILHPSCFILLAIWCGGVALRQIAWTEPAGEPVTVSLVQGNVPQELKWREERLRQTLETYLELARAATGRLIVLPE